MSEQQTDRRWLALSAIVAIKARDQKGTAATLCRLTASVEIDSPGDAEKIRGIRRAVDAGDWAPACQMFGVWA